MTNCEHCGSPLLQGAIFCGDCGRAVSSGSARRSAAPAEEHRDTPPPLQQPDPHGRPRQDPASEAWLPEATLDPATRAWLAGRDRGATGPVAPIPVDIPDERPRDGFGPRTAPSHVHGSGSGVASWARETGEALPSAATPSVHEPSLDPDAFPSEPAPGPLPEDRPAPAWSQPVAPPAPPAAPSWWVGRSTDAAAADDSAVVDRPAPVAPAAGGEPAPITDGTGAPDAVSSGAPSDVRPAENDTAVVEPLVERRAPRPTPLVQPGSHAATCHVCGHALEPDDIFCEECGAVRPAVTAAFTGPVVPLPIQRPDWAATEHDLVSDDERAARVASEDERAARAASDDDRASSDEITDEPHSDQHAGGPSVDHRVDDRDEASRPPLPGSATVPSSAPRGAPLPAGSFAAPLPPVPGAPVGSPSAQTGPVLPSSVSDPVPTSADADESSDLDEDVEATRIVATSNGQAPFVLHFSTGERVGVHGTGLLGRLPRPEPGERFDDLVTVRDPGKSVSKTHLELGRDGDDLWVSDRFSGNGTVVRHIDGSIRRCEPGRRYRVERGARVDIGEQFFLVQ